MPRRPAFIIYQNRDIVVVNKPAGVSVTADRSGAPELKDILKQQLGEEQAQQLKLVHRLDKETSGIIVLAKNREAQSRFSKYFESRVIKKTYLALVVGAVGDEQGRIAAPLAQSRKKPGLMCVASRRGKKAVTEWRLLADFGSVALLAVSPLTGRTHQIRVHLASAGLPLAIDPLYAGKGPLFLSEFKRDYRLGKKQTEKPLIDRLTLHAYQLEFPTTEKDLPPHLVAPLDRKFKTTVKMLAKHNPRGAAGLCDPDELARITADQPL